MHKHKERQTDKQNWQRDTEELEAEVKNRQFQVKKESKKERKKEAQKKRRRPTSMTH